jgi:hypothetical protein
MGGNTQKMATVFTICIALSTAVAAMLSAVLPITIQVGRHHLKLSVPDHEGRLEIMVDNQILVTDSDLVDVGEPILRGGVYGLPVLLTEEGRNKLNAGIVGKAGHPLAWYVDRPHDAVIIFDELLLHSLVAFTYDENDRLFWERILNYPLLVPAIKTDNRDILSPEAEKYLEGYENEKSRAIIMGAQDSFSVENFVNRIPDTYEVEFSVPGLGQSVDEWIADTCGHIWAFPIDSEMAEDGMQKGDALLLPVRGDLEDAEELRGIIQRYIGIEEKPLPVLHLMVGIVVALVIIGGVVVVRQKR